MKKTDITKDAKRLSVEIVEYWRMELYEGCWLLRRGEIEEKPILFDREFMEMFKKFKLDKEDAIPIPTISDCLNKLRDRKDLHPDYINTKHFDRGLLNIFRAYVDGRFTEKDVHYWLLSALLEVLTLGET